jgi:hypothetical protein
MKRQIQVQRVLLPRRERAENVQAGRIYGASTAEAPSKEKADAKGSVLPCPLYSIY